MPTEEKVQQVDEIKQLMESCTIAISTDYSGMAVGALSDMRRVLRERGVRFRVIKNSLAYLAAEAADRPSVKSIIEGPTGMAFGFGDPVEPAKTLVDFIRSTRAPLKIRGGILGERVLTDAEVNALALLPPREQLIARLLGQLVAPITGLVYTLNAPISGLATVLRRRVEVMEKDAE